MTDATAHALHGASGAVSTSATPYAGLTPHAVLDALDAVGLRGDGRILQLNSYENRVFQVTLEDGPVVVAKFYRDQRWSDEQILEEHRFARELSAAEVPLVAPLSLTVAADHTEVLGEHATLAKHAGWRFAGPYAEHGHRVGGHVGLDGTGAGRTVVLPQVAHGIA